MSQNTTGGFDPNDPFGNWRTIRDANLDAWAKGMTSLVNTEVFAKAIGLQLDTLLAASAPVQDMVNQHMETYLAKMSMPSRGEVVSLAGRLTNIELRLDDMQAQLDEVLEAIRSLAAAPAPVPAAQPAAPEAEEAAAGEPKPATPRRSRKTTE
ncbi:hypothetical protein [Candidatus Viridilinea mediisalina]|uniref:Poly(3-hydroxyalkanoate) polymerase subunit PhaE n=1 Tax=Candidatus Viridilinea mediisalina TaxID=2024553 RepID=A0A2A6RLW9_9CHLR|nr:hypothetical protein [Candidatus Viridilinea mediisalina]PDW03933.1 hypothetical protein CJ255_06145 [Candidatus Viridilinea mediisalina]